MVVTRGRRMRSARLDDLISETIISLVEPSVSGVGVLDKAVAVLDAVRGRRRGRWPSWSTATGLSRATAHRLAVALEAHGLVRRDDDGRFALGAAARRRSAGRRPRRCPLAAAAPAGARPSCATRPARACSSTCATATGGSASPPLESPHGLRTIVPLGRRLPLDRRVRRARSWPIRPLRRGIGAAGPVGRERGRARGRRGVGVARRPGRARRRVAAVSVSGPIERTTRQPGRRYGDAVVAAARRVERAAGLRQERRGERTTRWPRSTSAPTRSTWSWPGSALRGPTAEPASRSSTARRRWCASARARAT